MPAKTSDRRRDHRNHEAGGRASGDAHVDVVFVNHIGAVNLGVDLGTSFRAWTAGLGKERHKAQFDAVLFEEQIFVFVAQGHHLGHVDLVVGGQHGGGVLAVFQTARDGLAQAGHFHALFAGGLIGGNGCTRGRSRCGAAGLG